MNIFNKLFTVLTDSTEEWVSRQEVTTNGRGYVNYICKRPNDLKSIEDYMKRYVAFDVETTGLDSKKDRIIEVGAILFENGHTVETYSSLVNPEVKISKEATTINHITNGMVKKAPTEDIVCKELVKFLGDALHEQTPICAHNADFDMSFLSQALMRQGYDAQILCLDTLSLSRKIIPGLSNYKQTTVAKHFNIKNKQEHRAISDAEVCGEILWKLLSIKKDEEVKKLEILVKSKPSPEEMEVCAFIQDCILKKGGDNKFLGFYKNSNRYIDVSYLYSFLRFKFAKKGKYIIVNKQFSDVSSYKVEPCTISEGGTDYIRVYFNNPFELEGLSDSFYQAYRKCRNSALDYFEFNKRAASEHKKSIAMSNKLTVKEMKSLLKDAKNREYKSTNDESMTNKGSGINLSFKDIDINPIHNRVQLSNVKNLNNERKAFDEGYPLWEKGDQLRKNGNIQEAIDCFEKARFYGYNSSALYESYAKAYHAIKDYENEIDILNEGIVRLKHHKINVGRFEARRDKAVELFLKQLK